MATTLTDSIYNHIQEDIISGALEPGQKLHIAQLAQKYDVGLSPIREALSRLLASELVVAMSQRGFIVAPVSSVDLHDVYQTRAYIETTALTLAIERGDDAWEASIVASFHSLSKFETQQIFTSPEHYQEWETRHRAFNLALISACGLNYLLNTQQRLYQLTERYRRKWVHAGIKHPKGLQHAKEQKIIMDAVLARNTKLATQLLFQHYEKAADLIESYFAKHDLFNISIEANN